MSRGYTGDAFGFDRQNLSLESFGKGFAVSGDE